MTEYHELHDVQARLQAALVKQARLLDLKRRFESLGDGQVEGLAMELCALAGEALPAEEFEFWCSYELQKVAGEISGLQDQIAIAKQPPRAALRQIRREKMAACLFSCKLRNYRVMRWGEEDLPCLRKKARLVRTLRGLPRFSPGRRSAAHGLHHVVRVRNRATHSCRRTYGANRSGPSAEAGPRSAGGDDPDGPPPPATSARANAPISDLNGDLFSALGRLWKLTRLPMLLIKPHFPGFVQQGLVREDDAGHWVRTSVPKEVE